MTRNSSCVVHCCKHDRKNNKCVLSHFPADVDRCRKWIQVIGDTDLLHLTTNYLSRNKFICSCHFNQSEDYRGEKKKYLKDTAVPSIFPPQVVPLTDDEVTGFPIADAIIVPSVGKKIRLTEKELQKITSTQPLIPEVPETTELEPQEIHIETVEELLEVPGTSTITIIDTEPSISFASTIQEKENVSNTIVPSSKRSNVVLVSYSNDNDPQCSPPKRVRIAGKPYVTKQKMLKEVGIDLSMRDLDPATEALLAYLCAERKIRLELEDKLSQEKNVSEKLRNELKHANAQIEASKALSDPKAFNNEHGPKRSKKRTK